MEHFNSFDEIQCEEVWDGVYDEDVMGCKEQYIEEFEDVFPFDDVPF